MYNSRSGIKNSHVDVTLRSVLYIDLGARRGYANARRNVEYGAKCTVYMGGSGGGGGLGEGGLLGFQPPKPFQMQQRIACPTLAL